MITLDDLPLRADLIGEEPYGAPQLDLPVVLNVNENPYPPSPLIRQEMAAAVVRAAGGLNRYPDREALGLRSDLAAYLGHGLTAENIWAANGSNEIMSHLLTAFGGPGRRVLTFTPTYSMYPEYARNTCTEYVTVPRRADYRPCQIDMPSRIIPRQPAPTRQARPSPRRELVCVGFGPRQNRLACVPPHLPQP